MSAPGAVWDDLVAGNGRFVGGTPDHPRQDADTRAMLAAAQTPQAALFGCSDSRLAAEIIFDTGLGDLFVVRNAGQVASDSALASLEFAVAALEVPLIVVLAHDRCGAVRSTMEALGDGDPVPPRLQREIVDPIAPAVRAARVRHGADADAAAVGLMHLERTAAELVAQSELIAATVAEGRLAIVGANYDLARGVVTAHTIVGAL